MHHMLGVLKSSLQNVNTWGREALGKMKRLKIVEPVLGSVSLALDF